MTIPHVLFNASGEAVNRLLLDEDHNWQPPAGFTITPDPDGSIWAIATAPPPKPPDPDWTQFRQALRTENGFSAAFQAAMAADPMAGIALALGLDNFRRDGDPRDFVDALHNAFATLSPDQGAYITGELLALAQRCNLPQEFLDALSG